MESFEFNEFEPEEKITKNEELFIEKPPEILNLDKAIEEFKTAKKYKFIYLVYAASRKSKYFSPYNFKIVPFKDVKKKCFFTLSNHGMLSYIQNDVVFTPLAKFVEDYRCYQQIRKVSRYSYLHIVTHMKISYH